MGRSYATIVGFRHAFLGLGISAVLLGGCSGVSTGTGAPGADGSKPAESGNDSPSEPSDPPSQSSSGSSGSAAPPTASGVTYPSSNLGWKPRRGSARGDTIPNVKLPGFAANSATPTTVSMAELYDPNGKTHDAIVIVGTSTWDPYSKSALPRALASTQRVRVLSVLGEAQSAGKVAAMSDLTAWRGQHPNATHMLDAGFVTFGAAFDQQAVPLVMVVVARTMEICTSAVGLPSEADLAADIGRCLGT